MIVVGLQTSRAVLMLLRVVCLCRVSQKVVEFYKALAAKEVPSVGKYSFPDIVFEIPPEEALATARRLKVDGRMVNGSMNMPSRTEKLFGRCPPEILQEPIVCYRCKKEGHPAFKCNA